MCGSRKPAGARILDGAYIQSWCRRPACGAWRYRSGVYEDPVMWPLLAVLAIQASFGTPASILAAKLSAGLEFRELGLVEMGSSALRYVSMVGFALAGYGPFSFVLPLLIRNVRPAGGLRYTTHVAGDTRPWCLAAIPTVFIGMNRGSRCVGIRTGEASGARFRSPRPPCLKAHTSRVDFPPSDTVSSRRTSREEPNRLTTIQIGGTCAKSIPISACEFITARVVISRKVGGRTPRTAGRTKVL